MYSRVQPAPTARVIVMPARVGIGNGFATGGAMRTPETINGPVLKHPVQQPAEVETIARPDASPTAAPARRAHAAGSRTAKPSAAKPMQVTSAPRP